MRGPTRDPNTPRRAQTEDSRRRQEPAIHGPTPDDIREALDALIDGSPIDVPSVSVLKVLNEAGIDFPLTVGNRRVLALDMAHGQPMHGEMRSDDHISRYEVEFDQPCPEDECLSEVTRFEYSAHHHIAGHNRKYCPRCETVHDSEEWG